MMFHPYAEVFPLLDDALLEQLAADIKAHGQREPIVLYQGKILDGRNRFLACQKAKVRPKTQKFDGDDPLAYVISANIHRRHLDASQLAMAAARVSTLRAGDNQHSEGVPIGTSSELFGVSERGVKRARQVLDHGSKALQQAVVAGDISVSRAAAVVDRPKSEQLEAATTTTIPDPVEPALDERWVPDEDEERHLELADAEYQRAVDAIMESSDALTQARIEIKRQADMIANLTVSRDEYMHGRVAVIKMLKKCQRENDRLRKRLGE